MENLKSRLRKEKKKSIRLVSIDVSFSPRLSVPSHSHRKLNNIAFMEMNPFPMKLLWNRRAHHLERLKAELRELESIQKEFLTESMGHKDRDLDPAVGEDEEDL